MGERSLTETAPLGAKGKREPRKTTTVVGRILDSRVTQRLLATRGGSKVALDGSSDTTQISQRLEQAGEQACRLGRGYAADRIAPPPR